MKRITEQPLLRFLPDYKWRLEEPFVYHVGNDDSDEVIVLPVGFVTDLASIPRPLWSLYPPAGPWAPAAIVHDWLYQHPQGRTRAEVDGIFLEAMEVLGVPWLRRHLMHRAVRIGAGGTWDRYREEDQARVALVSKARKRKGEMA